MSENLIELVNKEKKVARPLAFFAMVLGILLFLIGIWLFFALGVPPYTVLVLPGIFVAVGGFLVFKGFTMHR